MTEKDTKRWYRVMNKGLELNRICPWIYSDKWLELFETEMLDAWHNEDILIIDTWEHEFHMDETNETVT